MLKSCPGRLRRHLSVRLGSWLPHAFAVALTLAATPLAAQEHRADPLTRFIDGLLKKDDAAQAAPEPGAASARTEVPADGGTAPQNPASDEAPQAPHRGKPLPRVAPTPASRKAERTSGSSARETKARRASGKAAQEAASASPVGTPPAQAAPPRSVQRTAGTASAKPPIPATPLEALARLNRYFNSIDQMTANFVQVGGDGQQVTGSLVLQRPGRFRFAYAAPSTLEIVSDGHNVAIRDSKLHTNDVYPVGQTPLKFLVQDDFDLARATNVRGVRTAPDGVVTVKFDDTSTLGGTSQIELTYDAAADKLIQWMVIDPQGYRTTVRLDDVNVVRRQADGTN